MKNGRLQNFALWEDAARLLGLSAGGAFSDEVRRGANFSPRPAGDCCLKNRRRTSSRLLRKICSDEVVDALMGVPTTSCRRVSQTRFRRGQTRSDEVGCSPAGNTIKPYPAAHFSTRTGSFPAARGARLREYKTGIFRTHRPRSRLRLREYKTRRSARSIARAAAREYVSTSPLQHFATSQRAPARLN